MIAEPPLQLLPSLAKRVGLNQALMLQQIHYLSGRSEGGWVHRSVEEWRAGCFGFWSVNTIRRTLEGLRAGHLIEAEGVPGSEDRTLRYRVVYDHPAICSDWANGLAQIGRMTRAGDTSGSSSTNARGNHNGGQKSTASEPVGFDDWLEHHATVTGSRAMMTPGSRIRAKVAGMFAAALKEGKSVEELRRVSVAAWADEHRRSHGYVDPESVLRPGALERLLARPAGSPSRSSAKRETRDERIARRLAFAASEEE